MWIASCETAVVGPTPETVVWRSEDLRLGGATRRGLDKRWPMVWGGTGVFEKPAALWLRASRSWRPSSSQANQCPPSSSLTRLRPAPTQPQRSPWSLFISSRFPRRSWDALGLTSASRHTEAVTQNGGHPQPLWGRARSQALLRLDACGRADEDGREPQQSRDGPAFGAASAALPVALRAVLARMVAEQVRPSIHRPRVRPGVVTNAAGLVGTSRRATAS